MFIGVAVLLFSNKKQDGCSESVPFARQMEDSFQFVNGFM
jgi:hypothetical protein